MIKVVLTALIMMGVIGIGDSTKVIEKASEDAQRKTKTIYDVLGRAKNQGFDNKGLHRITGSCTLTNGVDTVTLNSSPADGKNDVTFLSDTTYSGRVWSTNIDNRANRYYIIPISGKQFIVVSSDAADTATVRYIVEGE